MAHEFLYSDRGLPLMLTTLPVVPTVTLENYMKWYNIYIVHPEGLVERLEDFEEEWSDHVPSPEIWEKIKDKYGFEIHSEAKEIALGRYLIEKFDGECPYCRESIKIDY